MTTSLQTFTIALGGALALAACTSPEPSSTPPAETPASVPVAQDRPPPGPPPGVTIAADPAPPFAYWAPEGSTIRNHPSSPGVWIAEGQGEVVYYFGDECGASRYQIDTVGTDKAALENVPAGVEVRDYVQGQPLIQNLVPTRLNVERDGPAGRILSISCG